MAAAAVSGIAIVLINFAVYSVLGWNVDAICPGTPQFCADIWWSTTVEYMALLFFLGLVLVVLVQTSPWALVRA